MDRFKFATSRKRRRTIVDHGYKTRASSTETIILKHFFLMYNIFCPLIKFSKRKLCLKSFYMLTFRLLSLSLMNSKRLIAITLLAENFQMEADYDLVGDGISIDKVRFLCFILIYLNVRFLSYLFLFYLNVRLNIHFHFLSRLIQLIKNVY